MGMYVPAAILCVAVSRVRYANLGSRPNRRKNGSEDGLKPSRRNGENGASRKDLYDVPPPALRERGITWTDSNKKRWT